MFFENPFWVAIYERLQNGRLEACKITFGAEPKDCEVYEYFLQNWGHLQFSPPVSANEMQPAAKTNPKRMQRQIKQLLRAPGVGTKAQEAIKLQHTSSKQAHLQKRRLQCKQEKERQFALKQAQKKQKHKGH